MKKTGEKDGGLTMIGGRKIKRKRWGREKVKRWNPANA